MSNVDKDIPIRIKDDRPRATENLLLGDFGTSTTPPKETISLANRSVLFQGLALSASAIILIYLGLSIHQFIKAQSLYEAAQQQRIYNQRFAKEILLAGSGVPVSYEKTSQEWMRTMNLLAQGGELLVIKGESAQLVQPPLDNARFKEALSRLDTLHHEIVDESENYLQSAKLNQHRVELFDELYRQSLEFQAAGDALVDAYDEHLDSGISWWDVNAVAVELAERQRMLIQQHVKEVLFVAHGIPADYQTTRLRLYESLKILTDGGKLSIDKKDAITIPPPGSEDIRFNLAQQKEALDRFTAVSNQLLMLANEDVERSIKLKKMSDLTTEFHEKSTELLAKYRSFFEGRIRRASRDAVAAGLLTIFFVLLLTWSFVNKYIDRPLKNIIAGLRNLRAAGPTIASVESAPGLAGEAVFELNAYMQKRRMSEQWFRHFMNVSDGSELQDPGPEDPVASRVYQWYRDRGNQKAPSNRWSSFEDNGIEILGRLPDAEPSINDSDLLDDLLRRANDLQSEQDRLAEINRRLAEETSRLNHVVEEHCSAQNGLKAENDSLQIQLTQRIADYEALYRQVQDLQLSERSLQAAGLDSNTLFEHIKHQLVAQESQVRLLREDVEIKKGEAARAHSDLQDLRKEAERADTENRRALIASIDEHQHVIAAKDEQLAHLTKQLIEAELRISMMSTNLEQSSSRAQEESRRREEAILRITELSARAEAEALSHSEAAEQVHQLRTQSKAEALRHEETMRQIAELMAGAEVEAARYRDAVNQITDLTARLKAETLRYNESAEQVERLTAQSHDEAVHHDAAMRQITELAARAENEAIRYQDAVNQIAELTARAVAENLRYEDIVLRAAVIAEENGAREEDHAEQIRKMDSVIIEAQREHARALEMANAVRAELQARSEEQLRKIEYQQESILQLQRALADQTSLLEGIRYDFSKARESHIIDLQKAERLQNSLNEDLRNSIDQNSELGRLLQISKETHESAQAEIGAFRVRVDGLEAELWQLRRVLAERNADLEDTRTALAKESDVLRSTREEGIVSDNLMRAEIARLKALLTAMEKDYLEEREQLQGGLKSAREAFREKCLALISAEERLSATRVALKASLEELQENPRRTA